MLCSSMNYRFLYCSKYYRRPADGTFHFVNSGHEPGHDRFLAWPCKCSEREKVSRKNQIRRVHAIIIDINSTKQHSFYLLIACSIKHWWEESFSWWTSSTLDWIGGDRWKYMAPLSLVFSRGSKFSLNRFIYLIAHLSDRVTFCECLLLDSKRRRKVVSLWPI